MFTAVNAGIVLFVVLLAALVGTVIYLVIAGTRSGPLGEASVDPSWVKTGDTFRDPANGRVMRIYTDPDRARHYLPDA